MDSRSTPLSLLLQSWDKHPALRWGLSALGLALLCGGAFFLHLGSVGLIDETEPLFAEAARQMTVTGDWITPYFNGDTRFDKPPLIYWLMAIAYQTLGVNEWSVRLPSALSATALTVMGFYVLRRFGFPSPAQANDPQSSSGQRWAAAWIGAALMALNAHTLIWARTGVSDMLLSGCMGTALLSFFCGYTERDRPRVQQGWYFAFYTLTALAVLAKGPVGLVIPGLTIICFLAYTGNLWTVLWKEMHLVLGILWFVILTLPWYVLVILENGAAYTDSFFGYHNFERFTQVVNNHGAPWYFYFIVVLAGFFPGSIYLPVAIARLQVWRRSLWVDQPRSGQLSLFALAWFGVIFGFFTVAVTKLPSYVLPLMPAAAILVGLFWSDQLLRSPSQGWAIRLSHGVTVVLSVALGIALLYSPAVMGDDPAMPTLPEVIQQTSLLQAGTVVWLLMAIAMVTLWLKGQGRWFWSVHIVGFAAFLMVTVMPMGFIVDELRQAPLRHLAQVAVAQQRPNEPIAMVGFSKPSLVFYTQQPILYLSAPSLVIQRLQRLGDRPDAPDSLLLLGYPGRLRRTGLPLDQAEKLEETDAFQLFRVTLPLPDDLPPPPEE
ncbi:glycosyltransferase family 39 protein [Leptolyngbya sp. CCY15150]|uniref:ArnT family glycosyltransferase n=1 Tax=Leptolyngbya sp. CCY15150 TaxID=2767772 RepID=UPI00195230B0|nr:glycosyltransferase family 39 protein [Leptolyngbya sp. CCY15150]